ncbi:lytic polysaccharide monooxygenase [Dactylosporangium sp. AC04546]|uniref:lytic polysaccharide monooxygenase auxiliary activity family 9 protein n=1 Tax=Dactylosporangium sp. AC04546 TaxID=2862460 RepID=UPI001EDD915C|nr:lytic polysaccharide monooxygenase [Dactylosporangium sp. AC04546]WVK87775.1 lytic polysaccharide monooxygenase [Dactylosporangium sp. AC04546]
MYLSSARAVRFGLAAIGVLVAALALVVVSRPDAASAHGSVTDPASRNWGCWSRWGSDFQNPNMANVDPMCWQAWQANPNTMWNWNGLYREGVAGNHQAAIPDGQLCSGGRTQNGFYGSLDTVGTWTASTKPNQFTLTLTDQAQHGADYLLIYITKQGFDSTTQPLTWANLELVNRTGRYAPAPQYQAQVNAGNRTGRHVVYTIWQASHLDQSYYICSDVIFTGGTGPSPSTSASPSPSRSASASASASASPSPSRSVSSSPPPAGGCSATYAKTSEWAGGFGANVTVTAGSSGTNGWTVRLTWPNGQTITSYWNATITSSGGVSTATNVSYNGKLSAGQSTSFGFNGAWTGSNNAPTLSCTAT